MTPKLQKLMLTAHVVSSVGLLGSVATFLALAVTSFTSQEADIVRAAYLMMDLAARFVIVPLALASLASGLIESLTTPWGLFRHYWVLAKFLLTVLATIVLLLKLELIGYGAELAATPSPPWANLRSVGAELALHALGGLFVLLATAALSIYKPRGLTFYAKSSQREQRAMTTALYPRSGAIPESGAGASSAGEVITLRLSRSHLVAFVGVVLIVHFVILHLAGTGLGGH